MSISLSDIGLSEAGLSRLLRGALVVLALTAAIFYLLQNQGKMPGGAIAFPKLLWLFLAITVFFLVPVLFSLDRRLSPSLRSGWQLFSASMIIRGVVELYLIYVALAWRPSMGIGHDLFSILLLLWIAIQTRTERHHHPIAYYSLFAVGVAMAFETAFAVLFRKALAPENETLGSDAIYFVPPDSGLSGIIGWTWIAVLFCLGYIVWLMRRWPHAGT